MDALQVTFCSAVGWLVPYRRCQKHHWVPPGYRTWADCFTSFDHGFLYNHQWDDYSFPLSTSTKADSSWHCNGLHTTIRYLNDVRDLESWWESWAALLRAVKATTGTWIWILSRGPENVNGAYSCLHQRDSSLCMFLPRGWGGSQWDLFRVWTEKEQ